LIGFEPTDQITSKGRVVLWIDELEDLIYYTTRYYRPFTQGLRELIDRLPHYFTVFLNISLASPEVLEDIETILGKALLDRVTNQVYFREPSDDEAYHYVQDLLSYYRTEDLRDRQLPEVYPFSDVALRMLIANLPTHTPRDINQRCSEVITQAIRERIISEPGVGLIDEAFVLDSEKQRREAELG
jgi:SpoVK/Ycf46/Vps4 family AAA+-type ATPase